MTLIKSVSLPQDQVLMLYLKHPAISIGESELDNFLQSPLESYNEGY